MQNTSPKMRDPGQLTDQEVKKTKHDLEYMRRRHLWSYLGLLLPLVHSFQRDPDGTKRIASLIYSETAKRYIFLPDLNIFEIDVEEGKELHGENARTGNDDLLISLILEGWTVD